MGRNYLKGRDGDRSNAVLAGGKTLAKTEDIACHVLDGEDAAEVSLAENVVVSAPAGDGGALVFERSPQLVVGVAHTGSAQRWGIVGDQPRRQSLLPAFFRFQAPFSSEKALRHYRMAIGQAASRDPLVMYQ